MAVLYYRKGEDDDALDEAMSGLVAIKEEAMLNDIYFVLVSDQGSDSITRSLWSHHKDTARTLTAGIEQPRLHNVQHATQGH